VRVVAAEHGADDRGALSVLGVRPQVVVVQHRVQDPALDRLQAIADVRECPRGDDAERIVQVASPRLGLEGGVEVTGTRTAATGATARRRRAAGILRRLLGHAAGTLPRLGEKF
jgi:hypothetical protein